jgi:hypothetical protein
VEGPAAVPVEPPGMPVRPPLPGGVPVSWLPPLSPLDPPEPGPPPSPGGGPPEPVPGPPPDPPPVVPPVEPPFEPPVSPPGEPPVLPPGVPPEELPLQGHGAGGIPPPTEMTMPPPVPGTCGSPGDVPPQGMWISPVVPALTGARTGTVMVILPCTAPPVLASEGGQDCVVSVWVRTLPPRSTAAGPPQTQPPSDPVEPFSPMPGSSASVPDVTPLEVSVPGRAGTAGMQPQESSVGRLTPIAAPTVAWTPPLSETGGVEQPQSGGRPIPAPTVTVTGGTLPSEPAGISVPGTAEPSLVPTAMPMPVLPAGVLADAAPPGARSVP